jgi:cation:H+ antiporter
MFYLLLTLLGFLPLVFGANILVDGASSLAKKLNIPNIVIGLTIVAFGTSAPELIVNIFAALSKNTEIVLGNIVGSNIFNILGILGVAAFIYPLAVKTNTTWIEIPLALLASVSIIILGNDSFIDNSSWSGLSRIDGIVLLLFFIIFLSYNIKLAKAGRDQDDIAVKDLTIFKSILLLIIGFGLLVLGGRIIVLFAVKFAQLIGIPERIIALTIISIGTSLPELATSIIAALKRNVDIAIGNVVGSNIFNIFFILGLSSVITPVQVMAISNIDLVVNIVASLMLFVFIFTGKERKIEKWEGIIFILLYISYIYYLIFN